MATSDISLIELPGTFEQPSISAPLLLIEFGQANSSSGILSASFPEGMNASAATVFGFPKVFAAPFLALQSLGPTAQIGEPWADVTGGSGPPPPDPTAPTVTNVMPAAGAQISTGTPWQCDVNGTLAELLIWVAYSDIDVVEMAFDGSALCPDFSGQSKVTSITSSTTRVILKRNGGWPSAPRFLVRARSTGGGVNV